MPITLARTSAETRHIAANLFTAYFYDLSQYDDQIVINAHGLPVWEPFGLPGPRTLDECAPYNWWVRDQCEIYLVLADGSPAGFVIIAAGLAHIPEGIDFELQDFYIAPRYRRRGIGRIAARLAFELHHGAWVVYQLERNHPARVFWQGVVNEYTGGQYENLDGGTQQRFRN
jgi:predicted acetyltransferase